MVVFFFFFTSQRLKFRILRKQRELFSLTLKRVTKHLICVNGPETDSTHPSLNRRVPLRLLENGAYPRPARSETKFPRAAAAGTQRNKHFDCLMEPKRNKQHHIWSCSVPPLTEKMIIFVCVWVSKQFYAKKRTKEKLNYRFRMGRNFTCYRS